MECEAAKIDPDLFCAIVNHESSWNKNAIKFERGFPNLWCASKYAGILHITMETEATLQSMSYGLCQLMGANFRWMGFSGPLFDCLIPETNIHYGVNFFKRRCDIHADIKDKISSYNMGTPTKKPDGVYINQDYVDQVYAYYVMKKQEK